MLPLYYQIQGNIELTLTEPGAADLINDLQSRGITTIALTARGFPIVKRTINQLRNLGISFYKGSFFDNYMKEPFYQCAHGIIFCAGHQKDRALFDVLHCCDYHPCTIIFVDDKMKYLQMIEAACAERNIPFIGIRYSGCDARVAAFNTQQADLEFTQFDQQCTLKLY
jgi:hypothetical protein